MGNINTVRMEFEIPSEILNYVSKDDKLYANKVKQLMIYALINEGRISFGKGAEILGISKIDLITDLGKLGIPYFNCKYEEIQEDIDALDKVMEDKNLN